MSLYRLSLLLPFLLLRNSTCLIPVSAIYPINQTLNNNLKPLQAEECLVPCNNIVNLLQRDAIPSIDNPQFMTPENIDDGRNLPETSLVLGINLNGVARAIPIQY